MGFLRDGSHVMGTSWLCLCCWSREDSFGLFHCLLIRSKKEKNTNRHRSPVDSFSQSLFAVFGIYPLMKFCFQSVPPPVAVPFGCVSGLYYDDMKQGGEEEEGK